MRILLIDTTNKKILKNNPNYDYAKIDNKKIPVSNFRENDEIFFDIEKPEGEWEAVEIDIPTSTEYLNFLIKNQGKNLVLKLDDLKFAFALRFEDIGDYDKLYLTLEDNIHYFMDTSQKIFKEKNNFIYKKANYKILDKSKILFQDDLKDKCIFSSWADLDNGCFKGTCDSVSIYEKKNLILAYNIAPTGEIYQKRIIPKEFRKSQIKEDIESVLSWFRSKNDETLKEMRKKLENMFLHPDSVDRNLSNEEIAKLKQTKLYKEFIKTIDKQAPKNDEDYMAWLDSDPYSDEKFEEWVKENHPLTLLNKDYLKQNKQIQQNQSQAKKLK